MAGTRRTTSKVPKAPKVHRERINVFVDLETIKTLDSLVMRHEVENRSAAVRYLARMYKRSTPEKR